MSSFSTNSPNSVRPPNHHRNHSLASFSGDEDPFSSITGFDDFANEDDLDLNDMDECKDSLGDLIKGDAAKKMRRLTSSADKKATHNAVERARRESLNTRFLVLADLLPGMNHVKRASKAAIVNKSIDLIRELQSVEKRILKDNESLRLELNVLRQQLTSPISTTLLPTSTAVSQVPAPAAPATKTDFPAPNLRKGNKDRSRPSTAPSVQQHHTLPVPMFSGVFNGLFNPSGLPDHLEVVSSESGSPSSASSSLPHNRNDPNSKIYQTNGFYDIASFTNTAAMSSDGNGGSSPLSFHSPNGTNGSLNGSGGMSQNSHGIKDATNVASPSSTHSVPTPGNACSPSLLPNFTATGSGSDASGPSITSPNPAVAAFDVSNDAAFLAAQFAPREIAKAQAELQQFINYQNCLAAAATSGTPVPLHHPMPQHHHHHSQQHHQQQQHQQQQTQNGINQGNPFASALGMGFPFPAPSFQGNGMANIPAWQMIMAQQQALSAYGGQMPF